MIPEHVQLCRRIWEFPLDEPGAAFPFAARLALENGWSQEFAIRVVQEYKRFAFLAVVAGHPVTPSDQVDQAWHLHLTYTRSYWERFCPDVLGRALHHSPTLGGAAERAKFHNWYQKTLESYQRFFGHAPPTDVWPEASARFGSDVHHRRVNTSGNWIIPKWPVKWLAGMAVLGMLLVCLSTGCSAGRYDTATSAFEIPTWATGNPLDLRGGEFLGWFAIVFGCAAAIGAILRCWLRRSEGAVQNEMLELDPYEVAYLAGGEKGALHAVLAGLVDRGMLSFDLSTGIVSRTPTESHSNSSQSLELGTGDRSSGEELYGELQQNWLKLESSSSSTFEMSSSGNELHPAERAMLNSINEDGATLEELSQRSWWWPSKIAERLQSLDLIVGNQRDLIGRVVPTAIILAALLVGVLKIFVGISRHQDVEILIIACLVAANHAVPYFASRLHRTWRGDRELKRLESLHAALKQGGAVASNVPLAVGLFGIGVLAGGALHNLREALMPSTLSGGAGGADGGGGCGGCGGCGCG